MYLLDWNKFHQQTAGWATLFEFRRVKLVGELCRQREVGAAYRNGKTAAQFFSNFQTLLPACQRTGGRVWELSLNQFHKQCAYWAIELARWLRNWLRGVATCRSSASARAARDRWQPFQRRVNLMSIDTPQSGKLKSALALCLCLLTSASQAASPVDVYQFPDAERERRYRALIDEFRCPKCLNVNISGSDAPIAQDLRAAVYRLVVVEDHSDDEVREFLKARYGDFVLYDPPLNAGTVLLWLGPGLFVVLGVALIARRLRHQQPALLGTDDERRLRTILGEE